ncbi:hypothetical protein GCM10010923_05880 [Blastomonas marina]|uniref:Serine protease n=1 Tax=Blastomonas marina TaxID=1867408 RepID=A0ABQ1F633_9SPHN|nr:hypothetical protein GCM10010923_05880 [Blastomonas marina]
MVLSFGSLVAEKVLRTGLSTWSLATLSFALIAQDVSQQDTASTQAVEAGAPADEPPAETPAEDGAPVQLSWDEAWQHSQTVPLPEPEPYTDAILEGECHTQSFKVPYPAGIQEHHKKGYADGYYKRFIPENRKLYDACAARRVARYCRAGGRETFDSLTAVYDRLRKDNELTRYLYALSQLARSCHASLASRQFGYNYAIRGGSCESCSYYLNPYAFNGVRSRMLEGLSYLAPRYDRGQNWKLAAETLRKANQSIPAVYRDYEKAARAGINAKRAAALKRMEDRQTGALLGGIAAALLGASPKAISDVGMRQIDQIERDFVRSTQRISQSEMRIEDFAVPAGMSDDGFRVVLPRLELWEESYGQRKFLPAYGMYNNELPFNQITRVVSRGGSCSGAYVGPGLVLTNKHCVVDDQFRLKQGIAVRHEYLYMDDGLRTGNVTYVVDGVYFPPGNHNADRRLDWAFVTMTEQQKVGWLGMLPPDRWTAYFTPRKDTRSDPARIAVAGYSADLNRGAYITMDWGCRAELREGMLLHRCRSWRGSSGSPIFVTNGNHSRRLVVGVHAASYGMQADGLKIGAFVSEEMYAMRERLRERQTARFGN